MNNSIDFTEDPDEDYAEVVGEEEFGSDSGQERNSETDNSEDDTVEEDSPSSNRKALIRDRMVHSLECCLNKVNYDEYILPHQPVEYKGYLEKPKKKSNAGKSITWTNQCLGSLSEITPIEGCLSEAAESVNSELMAWELFITPSMVDDIVKYTNSKIGSMVNELSKNSKVTHMKLTDSIEIKSFIGLLYARGLFGQQKHSSSQLFMEEMGHPVFGAVMSGKRFRLLHAAINFDDSNTRYEKWVHDRFAAMRDIFEQFNACCSSVLEPGDFLTVDETLYGCRTQVGFR